jgi:broad specificity phosphatase PhoE
MNIDSNHHNVDHVAGESHVSGAGPASNGSASAASPSAAPFAPPATAFDLGGEGTTKPIATPMNLPRGASSFLEDRPVGDATSTASDKQAATQPDDKSRATGASADDWRDTVDDAPFISQTIGEGKDTRPNWEYIFSGADLAKPDGVPEDAQYSVLVFYRHGTTNANIGEPMRDVDGTPIDPALHDAAVVDIDGNPAIAKWYAGNKLGTWVQLTPLARAQADALQSEMRELVPFADWLVNSPVTRAAETMQRATNGVEGLPVPRPMDKLGERGVAGLFGKAKTDDLKAEVNAPGYVPPVEQKDPAKPWTLTPDLTGPESERKFAERMGKATDQLQGNLLKQGNVGVAFTHQYVIGGIQDELYQMTSNVPEIYGGKYMPFYGEYNPPPDHWVGLEFPDVEGDSAVVGGAYLFAANPDHDRRKPVNQNGFLSSTDAGHKIPNSAALVRPGWTWSETSRDGETEYNFIPARKGFSNLEPPDVDEAAVQVYVDEQRRAEVAARLLSEEAT